MIGLRASLPDDADTIAALFTASRALLTFLRVLHTPEEDRAYIREHVLSRHSVTVAVIDGQIAGYMAEAPGWVEQLYVHPARLRHGVGSALLRAAQSRQDRLELWCFKQNARGRTFYEHHGFRAIEETDGSGNEEGAADMRYRWEAAPAS